MKVEKFLETLKLESGEHDSMKDGLCAMEAVAFLAGERHSSEPACCCPVIASFMRSWNDALNDKDRQRLKRYLPQLINSRASFDAEQTRGLLAADWYIRTFVSSWLALGGLYDHAERLRALPAIVTWQQVTGAEDILIAADSTIGNTIGSTVDSAACSAVRRTAESAAWDAAGSAACSAACIAAWGGAGSAASSVAWGAASSVASGARATATVERLQESAFTLLERMIAAK